MHFLSLGDTLLMSVHWPKFTGFFISAYQCHLQALKCDSLPISVEVFSVMFLCHVQPGLSVGLRKNTSSLIFMNLMGEQNTSESHWLDLYLNQC